MIFLNNPTHWNLSFLLRKDWTLNLRTVLSHPKLMYLFFSVIEFKSDISFQIMYLKFDNV